MAYGVLLYIVIPYSNLNVIFFVFFFVQLYVYCVVTIMAHALYCDIDVKYVHVDVNSTISLCSLTVSCVF